MIQAYTHKSRPLGAGGTYASAPSTPCALHGLRGLGAWCCAGQQKHHQHQVDSRLASSTSIGLLLAQVQQSSQHPEHQVDSHLASPASSASVGPGSITSISWAACRTGAPQQPSSASAGLLVVAQVHQSSQHHQHQVDFRLAGAPKLSRTSAPKQP